MSLFILEHGVATIDKLWVRNVPEFAEMLARSYKIKYDSDGRKKLYAHMEFTYIWYMEDCDSPYIELDEKERHKKAVRESGLHDIYEPIPVVGGKLIIWRPDELIEKARAKYSEIENTILTKMLVSIKRGLNSGYDAMEYLNARIQKKLREATGVDANGAEKELSSEDAALMLKTLDDILTIGNKLPATYDKVRDLEEKIKKDRNYTTNVRGGHRKGNRADPDATLKAA
jgi:hypothetical protein